MMFHKFFQDSKSILCLNGDLPDKGFFIGDKIIVATDGAADKLLKIGMRPSVIIGDLDSIEHSNYKDIDMVYLPDQSQSDFQKAMGYLAQNKLLPTVICGANGGFLDHILYNINVISENNCIFYSQPLIGQVLKAPAILNLDLNVNTKLSLFGMAKAKIRTLGLKWELNDEILEFPGHNSCFNRTVLKDVVIEILEGKLLILIYSERIEDMGGL